MGGASIDVEKDKCNKWELFFISPALIVIGLFII